MSKKKRHASGYRSDTDETYIGPSTPSASAASVLQTRSTAPSSSRSRRSEHSSSPIVLIPSHPPRHQLSQSTLGRRPHSIGQSSTEMFNTSSSVPATPPAPALSDAETPEDRELRLEVEAEVKASFEGNFKELRRTMSDQAKRKREISVKISTLRAQKKSLKKEKMLRERRTEEQARLIKARRESYSTELQLEAMTKEAERLEAEVKALKASTAPSWRITGGSARTAGGSGSAGMAARRDEPEAEADAESESSVSSGSSRYDDDDEDDKTQLRVRKITHEVAQSASARR